MEIKVIVGQIIGIILTVLCVVSPQFQRKWQMAAMAILSNVLSVLNFLLLVQISACGVSAVAILQAIFAIRHTRKGTSPDKIEIFIFAFFYVFGGMLPYIVSGTLSAFRPIDVLPIIGALMFLGYLAQKKEQRMRLFLLMNILVYLVYNAIILSTQFFAQLVALISVVVALIRYRKKEDASSSNEDVSL